MSFRNVTELFAECDPVPNFLESFYDCGFGHEAHEARAGSPAPLFRARSRSGPK